MTKQIKAFTAAVADWLDNDGPDEFMIDDKGFILIYADTRRGSRYEVWDEDQMELLAWNDNSRDFRDVGSFVLLKCQAKVDCFTNPN